MSLLKVSDNYSASIVGNFAADATTITVDIAPVKTAGYLTVFDLNGNQFEKIKYAGVSGLNLTGCVRGLSFDDNTDTPVEGNAKELKNGMAIKMTVSQHYLNPVIDFVNQYDGKWMEAVADFAALPNPASDGEVRVTLDDSKLYVYDLDTTTWNLAGAGGGAGTVYITTLLGTEAVGDDNMTFQLTSGSFPDKKYLQVYKNGVLMSEGAGNDYIATGSNQAVFNDAVLDDDVITLLVVSVDIYNPDWNSVDADVLPDLTDTHDIGSTTKKFKDLHLSGDVTFGGDLNGDGSNLDDGANGKLTSGTAANELVRLDGGAKLPAVDGSNLTNIKSFVRASASDNLKSSLDTTRQITALSWYASKSIKIFRTGTIRVKFDLTGNSGGTVEGRIYVNGSAVGTSRTKSGVGTTTYSEDISIYSGDIVSIYVQANINYTPRYLSNFRIYYDLSDGNDYTTILDS